MEKEGHQNPSFLFGTMHVRDHRAFRNRDLVFAQIDACESFATEFNLQESNSFETFKHMQLPTGKRLPDYYSERQYAKMKRILLKAAQLDLSLLENLQPILISNLIADSILSNDMPHSLDMHLFEYAKSQDKTILGIETFEEQLQILRKIPLEYQLKALLWLSKHISQHRRQLTQMARLYEEGNPQKIYKNAKKNAGNLRKVLLYNRNEIMAERIGLLTQDANAVCCCGSWSPWREEWCFAAFEVGRVQT